jgi:hypothetical protein
MNVKLDDRYVNAGEKAISNVRKIQQNSKDFQVKNFPQD